MKKSLPYLLIGAGAAIIALVLLFLTPTGTAPQARQDVAAQSFAIASPPVAASSIAPQQGGLSGGEQIVIAGSNLDQVTEVEFNGTVATIVERSADQLTVTAPHSISYTAGDVPVTLSTAAETVTAPSYTYATLSGIDRQLEYAFAHWNNYNLAVYGNFNEWGGDCINFVSQTLVARGWAPTDEWFNDAQEEWGDAFVHVPSFDEWLSAHPEYGAVRLNLDDARDQAKIGDVVLFDWDGDGSLDHAQVVSDVSTVNGETRIAMVGHNLDTNYRDVDFAVSQQGGAKSLVYLWSIPAA